MRVLHIDAGNMFGGVETLLATLARNRALTPEVEPEFALCFEGRLSRELTGAGVPLHMLGEVRVRYPLTVMRARRRLRQILSTGSYDAVVCHMAWTQALFGSVARAARVPVAMWQHMASNGRHWLEQWARYAGPELVICTSHFAARAFSGVFSTFPVEVVHCPVAAPSISYSQSDRDRVRSELTTAADSVVITHTGRMQEWKGQRLLLQAASIIKSNSQWTIWLVGGAQRESEQHYLNSLRATATELGIEDRIRFAGNRDDVDRLLAASDIHCQPNISPEPFGIAFIEALYAGLPVVTTQLGGAIEIVNDSCGVTVAPNNTVALAAALGRLVGDDRERRRLGNAGPARARELCDPQQQMNLLRRALLNLCGESRKIRSQGS
ncbi:MAG TPA: glycosyltransferase [Candidatus Acidoferrales bacterium]|jgi:glycosyltransferase involved in cell wall biosynthesis|nr:glycosyltransferase [Candidatus Acidoferrales bacterium]